MTLVWDQKIIPASPTKLPLSWTAREFVLVRSFHGQSRYEIVGRWRFIVAENLPHQSPS